MQFEFIYLKSDGNSPNPVNAAIIIRLQTTILLKKKYRREIFCTGLLGICKIRFNHYNFNDDNKLINSYFRRSRRHPQMRSTSAKMGDFHATPEHSLPRLYQSNSLHLNSRNFLFNYPPTRNDSTECQNLVSIHSHLTLR